MGEVYRARDEKLNRDVAIKILPAAFSEHPDRLRRFEQEAQAAGSLNHPNILAVYDVGTHDGAPYIVSELLEGESLRQRLVRSRLPYRKALQYGIHLAQALAAAHAKGISHRDVKPENVFVTTDGRLKLIDFGLAELTTPRLQADPDASTDGASYPGVVRGTFGYMSPEQVLGTRVDPRTDLF